MIDRGATDWRAAGRGERNCVGDRAYSLRVKWSVFRWYTGWLRIGELLEGVRGILLGDRAYSWRAKWSVCR